MSDQEKIAGAIPARSCGKIELRKLTPEEEREADAILADLQRKAANAPPLDMGTCGICDAPLPHATDAASLERAQIVHDAYEEFAEPRHALPTNEDLVSLGETAVRGYLDFDAAKAWFAKWLGVRAEPPPPGPTHFEKHLLQRYADFTATRRNHPRTAWDDGERLIALQIMDGLAAMFNDRVGTEAPQ